MFVKLSPVFKDYDWGGREFIQDLYNIEDKENPIAEAWYGCHKDGVSRVDGASGNLKKFIQNNPEFLPKGQDSLPFMLKILSIDKPLSVQVHPESEKAKEGYARDLSGYKDPVGKDEMVYALEPTVLLCGFASGSEIRDNFRALLPKGVLKFFPFLFEEAPDSQKIKQFFTTLYGLSESDKKKVLKEAFDTLKKETIVSSIKNPYKILKDLGFPFEKNEVSVLAPFFMQLVPLAEGDTLLIKAGTLHSFISGTVLELQNPSDNVFRCGLTNKQTDLDSVVDLTAFLPMNTVTHKNSKDLTVSGYTIEVLSSKQYNIEKKSTELLLSLDELNFFFGRGGTVLLSKGDCLLLGEVGNRYTLNVDFGNVVRIHYIGEKRK